MFFLFNRSDVASAFKKKQIEVDVDGQSVPVSIHRNKQARRLILRLDPISGGARLTLPSYVPLAEGLEFIQQQQGWLKRRLGKVPERVPFEDGAVIPMLGDDYTIRHMRSVRGAVWVEGDELFVAGLPEHVSRRVQDWLKKEAKSRLTDLAHEKAQQLGVKVGRVTVRDTRSRWGSCAYDGSLNFSWRMLLTPSFVFDFIVAHEVAHIIERNHGPGFHKLVDELTASADQAEAWLAVHGSGLHRYG
jgi:predicted metal-dependent hydrolase